MNMKHNNEIKHDCRLDTGEGHQYDRRVECGRSMVEMLGTLAIIGVLSIGGIAGYSYGMDKYRANSAMNDVNLRAVDLIAQVNRGGDLSLSEWPEKSTAGYIITLEKDTDGITGGIKISSIEKQVCEMLADDLLPEGVSLTINGEGTAQGKCKEENTLIFYYDAIVGGGQNDDEECNGVMVNDVCTPCPSGATVSADKATCICSSGLWDMETNACATPPSECAQSLERCGADTSKMKMSGSTLIYDGDVNCNTYDTLDFAGCNLKVNGSLNLGDLSAVANFDCKTITAESSTGYGISGSNLTSYNSNCKLIGKTSADGYYGVFLTNVNLQGDFEIEGHATNIQTAGGGVHLRGGTLTEMKSVVGTVTNSETGYGIYMEGITATNTDIKGVATVNTSGKGLAEQDTTFLEDLTNGGKDFSVVGITNGETICYLGCQ